MVRFIATLIAMMCFTDRFGRKSMIVVGGSLMAVCMWIVGALTKTYPPVAGASISAGQYAAIVLIFVWAVAFCFSVRSSSTPLKSVLIRQTVCRYSLDLLQRDLPASDTDILHGALHLDPLGIQPHARKVHAVHD